MYKFTKKYSFIEEVIQKEESPEDFHSSGDSETKLFKISQVYFFLSHNPSIDSSVFPLVSGTIFQTKTADRMPMIP
jgi:hypothetical protein